MKRLLALIIFCAFSMGLHAQVVDTTVCDVLKDPASFNGKMVRIKGVVTAGFDQFAIRDKNCQGKVNVIWLSYPEGTKGKAGPVATVQIQAAKNFTGAFTHAASTPVQLEKSKDFKDFDSALSAVHKQSLTCLGCNRYEVAATMVGRLDGVAKAGVTRDKDGKIVGIEGFGTLNEYPARLVLQSVSNVVPRELDFAKADAVVKLQPPDAVDRVRDDAMSSVGNRAMASLHTNASSAPNARVDTVMAIDEIKSAADIYGATSPIAVAIDRTTDVFAKKGMNNSVAILYGMTNEVSPKLEAQAARESPDGLIFNCTINAGRLQGVSMFAATVHMGEHIADVRNPIPDTPLPTLFDMEYQAWATTTLHIISAKERTLTISGGYVLWNEFWEQAERNKNLDTAISDYLRREELLSR
jgi:hypothetical protein